MSGFVRDPVPLAPFSEWCQGRLNHYGDAKTAAEACGVCPRTFGRWVRGETYNSDGVICLGSVDEALIAEGSTFLNELYPLDAEAVA